LNSHPKHEPEECYHTRNNQATEALQIKSSTSMECDYSLTALNLDVQEPVTFMISFSKHPELLKTGNPMENGRGIFF